MTFMESCRVIVGRDEHGLLVRTEFPDGSFVDARSTPDSDDTQTLRHDLLHTLLAVQNGYERSLVLWGVAHGGHAFPTAAADEEGRVMAAMEDL